MGNKENSTPEGLLREPARLDETANGWLNALMPDFLKEGDGVCFLPDRSAVSYTKDKFSPINYFNFYNPDRKEVARLSRYHQECWYLRELKDPTAFLDVLNLIRKTPREELVFHFNRSANLEEIQNLRARLSDFLGQETTKEFFVVGGSCITSKDQETVYCDVEVGKEKDLYSASIIYNFNHQGEAGQVFLRAIVEPKSARFETMRPKTYSWQSLTFVVNSTVPLRHTDYCFLLDFLERGFVVGQEGD